VPVRDGYALRALRADIVLDDEARSRPDRDRIEPGMVEFEARVESAHEGANKQLASDFSPKVRGASHGLLAHCAASVSSSLCRSITRRCKLSPAPLGREVSSAISALPRLAEAQLRHNGGESILDRLALGRIGDARSPLDQPSFKNTLSSGDRSTLALAFFFAILEQDPRRADKIVVFDDPFTSQDNFRRNHTAFQIRKCGEACAQVIVLSHDPFFLKLVWDKLAPADRKTLQLGRIDEANTAIAEWDIEKATQAQYRADVEVLQRYFTLAQGERRDVIQKIRPMLEAYCRNLYPTQFADQDSLGIMIGKIREAGAGHPLAPIADALDEINGYCRRYHHAENPNAANEPIDDAELNTYVKRSLRLAGFF
jgi:AAA domain